MKSISPYIHRFVSAGQAVSLAAIFFSLLLQHQLAFGQVTTGIPPFASVRTSTFDTVDNANLNVSFAIPIFHKAGRGLPFDASLFYNSSIWTPVLSGATAECGLRPPRAIGDGHLPQRGLASVTFQTPDSELY